MKKSTFILFFISAFVTINAFAQKAEKEKMVLITTDYGKITVKLYNETPGHRDNFLKLAEGGKFDGTIFHRVIKDFMIQGGEFAGCDNTIPAEINPKFIHKKGALAAARQSDNVNPKRESSGCQFYIVQGRVETQENMKMLEVRKNSMYLNDFFSKPENASYKERVIKFQQERNFDGILQVYSEIYPKLDKATAANIFKYTPEQIKAYTSIGGATNLDGGYTVFGEVVEGLDVIDKIAAIQTAAGDKPVQDVKMTMKIIPGK